MIECDARIAELGLERPLLQVVVDTEEEFDWGRPFDRRSVSVRAIEAQHLAQALFALYELKPTYVVDYPVATNPSAVAVLKGYQTDGQCQIGAHLHPWVNPPFDEEVSAFNSYPGNLTRALERRKLEILTDVITASFGNRPDIYKAGRYGVGKNTAATLVELGYRIDLSMVPYSNFGADGGPDFRDSPARPCWFGPGGKLLEIPLSRGFSGLLSRRGSALHAILSQPWGRYVHLGGVAARLKLLELSTLTPEGVDFASHRRLVGAMLAQGHRLFTLTYHSPSLEAGHTPYVRTGADLAVFLDRIKRILALFFDTLGARPTTPAEVREIALAGCAATAASV